MGTLKMKFLAISGLLAAVSANELAVGADCSIQNINEGRPTCALGGDNNDEATCCVSAQDPNGVLPVQERCAVVVDTGLERNQEILAVTVAYVEPKNQNECSKAGEGNNPNGDCVVCDSPYLEDEGGNWITDDNGNYISNSEGNNADSLCEQPDAVDEVPEQTGTWGDGHCIMSAAYLTASLAAAAYLMA